jgi:Tol biopolymer transport system component
MEDVRADLERLRRAPPPGTAVSPVPALPIVPRRGLRRALLAAAIVAVLGAVSFLVLRARRAAPSSFRFRLVAVPGAPRSPSFAPDGRMMAYVDEKEGVPQVWVKDLGEGTPVQVTSGTPPAARPRWSPRGDAIVFERRGQGIWAVPPLGGPPRQITDQGMCPAFFADGTRIAFARGDGIWTARLDGSEARPIEGVPTSYYASSYVRRCPAVSPDGREVAFFHPEAGPAGDLWLVPTAGGQARRLTFDSAEASAPSWTPDGRFLVFSSARRGSRTLWRVAAGGGEPEAVTTGAGDDLEPDVSAGQAILYTSTRITYRLMVLDPAHDRQRELLQRRAEINGAVFSPEGDRIAFFGLADRGLHLFTLRSDGSELRQVTRVDDERNVMPQWSRDVSALYYYRQLPSPSFRKVPAAGGASTTVVDGWTWEQHNGARWDPEERRLAFTLLEAGRPKATLVREVAAARERPLERAIYSPRWSADGTQLLGNDWEGRIFVCPAAGTPCHAVAEGRSASWSGDGARIYFQRPGRPLDVPGLRAVELWVVGRAGGEPRRVAVLEPQLSVATPAAISARDEVAWVQVRRENPELWLAEPAR